MFRGDSSGNIREQMANVHMMSIATGHKTIESVHKDLRKENRHNEKIQLKCTSKQGKTTKKYAARLLYSEQLEVDASCPTTS